MNKLFTYLPKAAKAMALMTASARGKSSMQKLSKIGWQAYSENVKINMAVSAGRITRIIIQEYTNAGKFPQNLCRGPKESKKYAYSDPDRGTRVPSSAYARAPWKKQHCYV